MESYVCARGLAGLPDGVWHYGPEDHLLTRVGPAPAGEVSALVLTGVPWRTCWRYAERGYRHLWWDAGTVLAQLEAVAGNAGVPARIGTGFVDREIAELVGARRPREIPLVTVALGPGEPALTASGAAAPGELGPDHTEFPLITETHVAGDLPDAASVRAWATAPGAPPGPRSFPRETGKRRTARRFAPEARVTDDQLRDVLASAAAPLRWDGGDPPGELRVIVNAGAGVSPGLHRWEDGHLKLVRPGPGRGESFVLGGRQDPARDAALLVILSADLGRLLAERGERGYRTAQLAAGIAVGRIYLAAPESGLACRGLTFNDDVLAELVPEAPAGLLIAAVGVPAVPARERNSQVEEGQRVGHQG